MEDISFVSISVFNALVWNDIFRPFLSISITLCSRSDLYLIGGFDRFEAAFFDCCAIPIGLVVV